MKYTTAVLLAIGAVKADFNLDHEIKIGMENFLQSKNIVQSLI
jgi:hypothetical protein